MKIDRLIGIITTLQQKGKVTAPYLAEKFEVSRRTINRDIEDICRAGIPIVTTQGADGGIQIMEGFQLDTTVFTEEELEAILIGVKSVDSVSRAPKHAGVSGKIGGMLPIAEHIVIDLASFYHGSLSEKIDLLKRAIKENRRVKFHYYYNRGEGDKVIEPTLIVFQWSNWYVFGFCTERNDFRMYKLHRLWKLELLEETFEPKEITEEKKQFGQNMTDDIIIPAIYEASETYRLVEEYGPGCYRVQEDGQLFTEWGFSSYERALDWFLGFGSRVQVLGPEDFKALYVKELEKMLGMYRG